MKITSSQTRFRSALRAASSSRICSAASASSKPAGVHQKISRNEGKGRENHEKSDEPSSSEPSIRRNHSVNSRKSTSPEPSSSTSAMTASMSSSASTLPIRSSTVLSSSLSSEPLPSASTSSQTRLSSLRRCVGAPRDLAASQPRLVLPAGAVWVPRLATAAGRRPPAQSRPS